MERSTAMLPSSYTNLNLRRIFVTIKRGYLLSKVKELKDSLRTGNSVFLSYKFLGSVQVTKGSVVQINETNEGILVFIRPNLGYLPKWDYIPIWIPYTKYKDGTLCNAGILCVW